jgi:4-hydroxy-tetrahydrodipicolinate reductase
MAATRVAVLGAGGRMGSAVSTAIVAAPDLELVAAVDPHHVGRAIEGGPAIVGERDAIVAAGAQVAVEFSVPASVGDNLVWLLEQGVHAVVGATGIDVDALERARRLAANGPARALVVPNFAIGAVLMMRFAAEASRHLPDVEIIEWHHDGKVDSPSGTAIATADAIAAARGDHEAATPGARDAAAARGARHAGVPIHSVRLPGLVAHQEVVLGGAGQTLTIRHDALDRAAFLPGVLIAVRRVAGLGGLVVGLDHVL